MSDKKKNYLIIALFIAIVAMSIGYAALAQVLSIEGTSNIDAKWDIAITDIQVLSQVGATDKQLPTHTNTTATFNVDLEYPGSYSIYLITVENKGTINAKLSEITGIDDANSANPTKIQYSVKKSDLNDELNVGESKTFEVKVEWLSSDENKNTISGSKTATIGFNYMQNQ